MANIMLCCRPCSPTPSTLTLRAILNGNGHGLDLHYSTRVLIKSTAKLIE